MNDPISLDDVAALPVIDPGDSLTRFDPYVMVPPDVRDALVEAVEAAQRFERMASYDFYPDARVQARLDLRAALARFDPPRAQEGDADG